MGRTCYISTDFVYVKFVRHNFKVYTIAVFVFADSQRVPYTWYVGMFMICLQTTFEIPGYSFSLIITIKLKAKCRFCIASMWLLYSLKKLL
jgi:hypothetical protein